MGEGFFCYEIGLLNFLVIYDPKDPNLISCHIQLCDFDPDHHRGLRANNDRNLTINIDGRLLGELTDLENCCTEGYCVGFSTSNVSMCRIRWDPEIGSHIIKKDSDKFGFEIMPEHRPIIKEFYCRLSYIMTEFRAEKEEADMLRSGRNVNA